MRLRSTSARMCVCALRSATTCVGARERTTRSAMDAPSARALRFDHHITMVLQQAQPSAPPTAVTPAIGSYIAQRYVVEASLGIGGMAEVYRVRDATSGATVALKRLNQELVARRPVVAMLFEREYHTLKQLDHPSIVRVHDYGICEL